MMECKKLEVSVGFFSFFSFFGNFFLYKGITAAATAPPPVSISPRPASSQVKGTKKRRMEAQAEKITNAPCFFLLLLLPSSFFLLSCLILFFLLPLWFLLLASFLLIVLASCCLFFVLLLASCFLFLLFWLLLLLLLLFLNLTPSSSKSIQQRLLYSSRSVGHSGNIANVKLLPAQISNHMQALVEASCKPLAHVEVWKRTEETLTACLLSLLLESSYCFLSCFLLPACCVLLLYLLSSFLNSLLLVFLASSFF